MMFWIGLWKFMLVASLIVFSCMSVWVTIGGARDIKRLLAKLREEGAEADDEH